LREDAGTRWVRCSPRRPPGHDDTGADRDRTVRWVGRHPAAVPDGFKASLGRLLGEYIEHVTRSDRSGPECADHRKPLPMLTGPPHAQFQQIDVARAL